MDKNYDTELHHAARGHQLEEIRRLIISGADPNLPNRFGRYPLHECVGSLPCVEFLASQGAADVNCCKRGDWSVLCLAAHKGYHDVVGFLARNGADLLAKTKEGYSPLHLAAAGGHAKTVSILLEAAAEQGIQYDMRTRSGMVALHLGIENLSRLHPAVKGLLHCPFPFPPAAIQGSVETCEHLLRVYPDDVELQDNGGSTPLVSACLSGNEDLVRVLLVRYHASLRVIDKLGRDLMMHAALAGHVEVMRVLLEFGLELQAKDTFQGFTPLHHACKEGHLEVVRFLIQHGVSTAEEDFKGRLPEEIGKLPT